MDKGKITLGDLGHELRHCYEGEWLVGRGYKKVKKLLKCVTQTCYTNENYTFISN